MNVKRAFADLIETTFGLVLTSPERAFNVPERIHLAKLFKHYGVDCVFDVGANRGQYRDTLRRIGFTGYVVSFEPVPELAAFLRKRAESDKHWLVEEIALDKISGPATFNVMYDPQFSSLLQPDPDQTRALIQLNSVTQQVSVVRQTLNEIIPRMRHKLRFVVPYLKMDTQGNDFAIVEGASELVRMFVGIQSELSFTQLYAGSTNYTEVIRYFRSLGFELSAMVPNNEGHFPFLHEMDGILSIETLSRGNDPRTSGNGVSRESCSACEFL